MRFEIAMANLLGDRPSNQDRCAVVERGRSALLVLADGMGGHARGELAAEVFVQTAVRAFERARLPIQSAGKFLKATLHRAHDAIVDAGLKQEPPVYPRTTAVICMVQGNHVWWAHVGDSRLYVVRAGAVVDRTRDHTYIQELLDQEAITEAQMQSHPMRNYVTQCLGGPRPVSFTVPIGEASLQFGDVVLLCSDGFWSAVDEAHWLDQAQRDDFDASVDELAELAHRNAYPASDNISIAALRLQAAQDLSVDGAEETRDAVTLGGVGERDGSADPVQAAIDTLHQAWESYHRELSKD